MAKKDNSKSNSKNYSNKRKKVLLLGAAGRVGSGFREEYLNNKNYQKQYKLILGVHSKSFKDKNFEVRKISIEKYNSVKRALKDIDVVVNLAANPDPEAKFEDLIEPNLRGAYNVFQAAADQNCERVIYASSIHAVKGYGHGHKVKSTESPKPVDLYGATKVFGEALCYTFFSQYGLSCLAIRVGAYTSNTKERQVCFQRHDYDHVISQRDMGQLIHKCITAPKKVG
ncbi:MAG: NAD-dependent epimerase/dehydratase family protein, partial [Candidatus Paceibacteria bacterium]